MKWVKRAICRSVFLGALLLLGLPSIRAVEPAVPGKVRVLVTYGGHDFEAKTFWAMWDALPGIVYTKAEMPKAADLLKPGLEKDFDVVVLYDQWQKTSPDQKKAFVELIKSSGVGLVSLHHNIGAHNDWDAFHEIIGGRYLREELKVGDKTFGPSKWRDDQDMRVTVADRQHPITQGVDDFEICDETYKNFYITPDAHVLLTTDHPLNDPPVAWVKQYGKSRVFYMMFGHGPKAWQTPAYSRLLANGIHWVAEKAAGEGLR